MKPKYKSMSEEVKNQQVKKKVNALTPTKENSSEIMINDPDTQLCITEKLRINPKDSKPDDGSDNIFPSSREVNKHSVNKSGEGSNTDCGNIKDSNVPTAITKSDDIENNIKVATFIRKVLNNESPKEKMEWPLGLLIESKQSVKISQQEFQNMIIAKTAEVMATKSLYAKQMVNISICKEQQRTYYKKYKQLLEYVNTLSAEVDLLNIMPCTTVKHVRNVGTNVNMPIYNKPIKRHYRYQSKKPLTTNL